LDTRVWWQLQEHQVNGERSEGWGGIPEGRPGARNTRASADTLEVETAINCIHATTRVAPEKRIA
jgi:hypothetical protein